MKYTLCSLFYKKYIYLYLNGLYFLSVLSRWSTYDIYLTQMVKMLCPSYRNDVYTFPLYPSGSDSLSDLSDFLSYLIVSELSTYFIWLIQVVYARYSFYPRGLYSLSVSSRQCKLFTSLIKIV